MAVRRWRAPRVGTEGRGTLGPVDGVTVKWGLGLPTLFVMLTLKKIPHVAFPPRVNGARAWRGY